MSQTSDDLLKFLRRLRAVREYTSEPIAEAMIEDMLEVGRWSGSSANRQPCAVIVVRDPDVKRQFGEWGALPAATAAVVMLIVNANDAARFDEGRLAERLLLAAAAHGLGSTVATLKGEGPASAKRLLGIPEDYRAATIVAIGHIDVDARRARQMNPQPRKPMEEFVHWDRWA